LGRWHGRIGSLLKLFMWMETDQYP
jgi:hypothetical protein